MACNIFIQADLYSFEGDIPVLCWLDAILADCKPGCGGVLAPVPSPCWFNQGLCWSVWLISITLFAVSNSVFSRTRSKGSPFTLGVWGLRVCSLDVAFMFTIFRNRSPPSLTVCNRAQLFATVRARLVWMCWLWQVLQKESLWRFPALHSLVSCGSRAASWHSDVSHNVSKVFESRVKWQAQYSCVVVKRCVKIFLAGTTLPQHLRRCVSFANCQGWTKWCQGANSGAAMTFSEMRWKWTEASHASSILRLQKAGRTRKTSILKPTISKVGGSPARNAHFDAPTFRLESLVFL